MCNNMDEPGGHYAKWDTQKEEDQYYKVSLMCGTLKKMSHSKNGLLPWAESGGNGERLLRGYNFQLSD